MHMINIINMVNMVKINKQKRIFQSKNRNKIKNNKNMKRDKRVKNKKQQNKMMIFIIIMINLINNNNNIIHTIIIKININHKFKNKLNNKKMKKIWQLKKINCLKLSSNKKILANFLMKHFKIQILKRMSKNFKKNRKRNNNNKKMFSNKVRTTILI